MSSSKPTHDLAAVTGSFTGRDGKTRNSYQTIGAAWSNEDGSISRLKLDSIPVSWDGVIYLRQRGDEDGGQS
jgi:hypothetical protein